jgi:hypothetical protein
LYWAEEIDNYPEKVPVGQQDWSQDAIRVRVYHDAVMRLVLKELGRDSEIHFQNGTVASHITI